MAARATRRRSEFAWLLQLTKPPTPTCCPACCPLICFGTRTLINDRREILLCFSDTFVFCLASRMGKGYLSCRQTTTTIDLNNIFGQHYRLVCHQGWRIHDRLTANRTSPAGNPSESLRQVTSTLADGEQILLERPPSPRAHHIRISPTRIPFIDNDWRWTLTLSPTLPSPFISILLGCQYSWTDYLF